MTMRAEVSRKPIHPENLGHLTNPRIDLVCFLQPRVYKALTARNYDGDRPTPQRDYGRQL